MGAWPEAFFPAAASSVKLGCTNSFQRMKDFIPTVRSVILLLWRNDFTKVASINSSWVSTWLPVGIANFASKRKSNCHKNKADKSLEGMLLVWSLLHFCLVVVM